MQRTKYKLCVSIFACSRQFLQSLCIGKPVSFKIEYTVRLSCGSGAIMPPPHATKKEKKNTDCITSFLLLTQVPALNNRKFGNIFFGASGVRPTQR